VSAAVRAATPRPVDAEDLAGLAESTGIIHDARPTPAAVEIPEPGAGEQVLELPIEQVHPNPHNVREDVGDVTEMAESIKGSGIVEPLIVVTTAAYWAATADEADAGATDFGWVIIAGHRRRAAAEKAGRATVPCIVRDRYAGPEGRLVMLIENLHREDLKEMEEARGFLELSRPPFNLSQRAIAAGVGCSQSKVAKRISLLSLPEDIQADVAAKRMEISEAVELARFADDPEVFNAVRNRGAYTSVDAAAKTVAQDRAREQLIAAKRAELEAAGGARFVDWPAHGYWKTWTSISDRDKEMSLQALRNVGVKTTGHTELDCHAVSLGLRAGDQVEVIEVCTDAQSHLRKMRENKSKAEQAKERKAAKERETAEAAAADRRRIATAAVKGRLAAATDNLAGDLALTILLDLLEEDLALACELLGSPLPEDAAYGAEAKLLAELAAKPGGTKRVAAAVAFAFVEERISGGWRQVGASTYLRWLQSQGHDLTGEERKLVQDPS
jgi:ParB/RepB/Spo0J family partition protein